MFTGIIQAVASIAALRDQNGLRTFTLDFPEGFCQDLAIGASVSTNLRLRSAGSRCRHDR